MTEEHFEKLESKKYHPKKPINIAEDINKKREIMKNIGIEENDVNEFFDIMDDRVYDKK